jgi:pyruvate dehydrogenase complex dehydrogenase (E1) component
MIANATIAIAIKCTRGFLLGATPGRTTLMGEDLQHDDGPSHVLSSVIPNGVSCDPTFAYGLAVIVQDRRFVSLGTDGFGRSDTRESPRTFFEVDRRFIVLAALKALADDGAVPRSRVSEAIARYGIDVDKRDPASV